MYFYPLKSSINLVFSIVLSSFILIILAGDPATTAPSGTSLVTTAPAATTTVTTPATQQSTSVTTQSAPVQQSTSTTTATAAPQPSMQTERMTSSSTTTSVNADSEKARSAAITTGNPESDRKLAKASKKRYQAAQARTNGDGEKAVRKEMKAEKKEYKAGVAE